MKRWNWHVTQSVWIDILLILALLLVSGCETHSSVTSSRCLTDEVIGIAPGDTEETKRLIVKHDRELICSCPEQYPEKVEAMECPDR